MSITELIQKHFSEIEDKLLNIIELANSNNSRYSNEIVLASIDQKINELKQRGEWLKSAFDNKPHLLKQLFENLEWYGLVECKLPTMDSYGKVIERYNITMVEQYFVDKIKRSSYPQNRALEKVLEYVKELYIAGISPEEIAYFVRKLNSLTKYWEVIE